MALNGDKRRISKRGKKNNCKYGAIFNQLNREELDESQSEFQAQHHITAGGAKFLQAQSQKLKQDSITVPSYPSFPSSTPKHSAGAAARSGPGTSTSVQPWRLTSDVGVAAVPPTGMNNQSQNKQGRGANEGPGKGQNHNKKPPLWVWILLVSAYLGMCSLGPAYRFQDPTNPMVKAIWESMGIVIILLPYCIFFCDLQPAFSSLQTSIMTLSAGFCDHVWRVSFVVALEYTSLGHACLFSYFHTILLVIYRLCTRIPVSTMELFGAMMGFIGAAICTLDMSDKEGDEKVVHTTASMLFGDFLAFLGGVAGVFFFLTSQHLSKVDVPAPWQMVIFQVVNLTLTPVYMFFWYGITMTLDTDPATGLLGFFANQTFFWSEVWISLVCNVIGWMGYIIVLNHVDALVVSIVCLLEPVGAVVFGLLLGVCDWPGIATYIGGGCVLGGTFVVTIFEEQEDSEGPKISLTPTATPGATPKNRASLCNGVNVVSAV